MIDNPTPTPRRSFLTRLALLTAPIAGARLTAHTRQAAAAGQPAQSNQEWLRRLTGKQHERPTRVWLSAGSCGYGDVARAVARVGAMTRCGLCPVCRRWRIRDDLLRDRAAALRRHA